MKIRASRPRSGFTLIELLVVIAIIAVLAGLLLPVMNRVREQGDSTKCTANLRQVGIAINLYTNENEGRLPGPLAHAQHTRWKGVSTHEGTLAEKLEKYLDLQQEAPGAGKPGTEQRNTVLVCPSWKRVMKEQDVPVYVMNFRDQIPSQEGSGLQPPWGSVEEGSEPVTKAALTTWPKTRETEDNKNQEYMDLSRTWAMKDADQEDFVNEQPAPPSAAQMPLKPVHGDHRNVLFYDFHVGKMETDDRIRQ